MADVFSEVMATPIANYQTSSANSGGSVNGTVRDLGASKPRSIGLLVHVARMDGATKTVDCKLQGATDLAFTTPVDLVSATQMTAVGLQRLNANTDIYRFVRAVYNVAGTFGANEVVTLAATLIATDAANQPVTQVA
jgi:hypothetical protein